MYCHHCTLFIMLMQNLQLGFDSMHFARIDYQDRQKRKLDKSLEVIWQGSRTFGPSLQVVNFLLLAPFSFLKVLIS